MRSHTETHKTYLKLKLFTWEKRCLSEYLLLSLSLFFLRFQAAVSAGRDRTGFWWVLGEASNQTGAVSPAAPLWAQLQGGELVPISTERTGEIVPVKPQIRPTYPCCRWGLCWNRCPRNFWPSLRSESAQLTLIISLLSTPPMRREST